MEKRRDGHATITPSSEEMERDTDGYYIRQLDSDIVAKSSREMIRPGLIDQILPAAEGRERERERKQNDDRAAKRADSLCEALLTETESAVQQRRTRTESAFQARSRRHIIFPGFVG